MKYGLLIVLILSLILNCTSNQIEDTLIVEQFPPFNPLCVDTNLIPKINVINSFDLKKYLVRKDSLYCNAFKTVPTQGYIDYFANTCIDSFKGKYGITFLNYVDTNNWQIYPKYAFVRDLISFDIDLKKTGKQTIRNHNIFSNDTNILKGYYIRNTADGDVADARWEIDSTYASYGQINCINYDTKTLEGEFELYFKLYKQSSLPGIKYSPKAHFRCGRFKARFN